MVTHIKKLPVFKQRVHEHENLSVERILSLELAPLSLDKVAGLHRASPSATLDRMYEIKKIILETLKLCQRFFILTLFLLF